MKVLVVSDSHGLTEELSEIKARHHVDYRIHCGDSELDLDATALEGFYKVSGNCDFDHRFPDEEILELEDMKFLIVHGHLHGVHEGLMTLSLRARELAADVVCFGHTHVAGAVKDGEQIFINPGSIKQSRGEIKEETYAILEKTKDWDVSITFYSIDGSHIKSLDYQTSL